MSSPSSPALVDARVQEQMEKFLLRSNTSQRLLLSKIDTQIVNNELIFMQKFQKPRRIILNDSKTPIMLNIEQTTKKFCPEIEITEKFRRMSNKKSSTSKIATQTNFYSASPYIITSLSPQTSKQKMISIYDDLVKTIKKSSKSKKLRIMKPKKKIKSINREINRINSELDLSELNKEHRFKDYDRKFKEKYAKEVLKDIKTSKSSIQQEILTQRFSLSTRKSKFKSFV